jgi:hypothetical protein
MLEPEMKLRSMMLLVCVVVAGCATDINMKNAQRYYNAGLQAEAARDWPAAREAYRRSLINARSGGGSPALVSAATYNLGRMTGYTCDYPAAEVQLRESLTLEQALPKPDRGNITKRWSELARLYQDEGRDQDAVVLYALAVPELEKFDLPQKDPVGFADYLDDYARSLNKTGQASAANAMLARAAELRAKNPGRPAQFRPLYFHDVCGSR